MDARSFETVMDAVSDMTPTQCACLIGSARKHLGQSATTEIINARGREKLSRCCPHCKSANVGGWGSARGLTRWRCKDCKKTFTGMTGTMLGKRRKRLIWLEYLQMMLTPKTASLREIVRSLGIHRNTAWRWRHCILQKLADGSDPVLSGICEFDETFTVESRKGSREWVNWEKRRPGATEPDREPRRKKGQASKRGLSKEQVPILVGRDRAGRTHLRILPGLSFKHINPVLSKIVSPDSIVCADGASCYRKFGKVNNIKVVQVNARKRIFVRDKIHHIQNSNSYQSRLKDFLYPFKGPATRYLKNYLGWHFWREKWGTCATPEQMLRLAL